MDADLFQMQLIGMWKVPKFLQYFKNNASNSYFSMVRSKVDREIFGRKKQIKRRKKKRKKIHYELTFRIKWFQAFNLSVGSCDSYDDGLTPSVSCVLALLIFLYGPPSRTVSMLFYWIKIYEFPEWWIEILFSLWYSTMMGLHQAVAHCMDHCQSAAITADESWFKTVVLAGGSACLPGLAGRSQFFQMKIFHFCVIGIDEKQHVDFVFQNYIINKLKCDVFDC